VKPVIPSPPRLGPSSAAKDQMSPRAPPLRIPKIPKPPESLDTIRERAACVELVAVQWRQHMGNDTLRPVLVDLMNAMEARDGRRRR
jgi:hypothetical protein